MADTRKESDGEWKTLRVPVIVEARLHNAMPETDISTLERNVDGLIAKQPNIGDGDLPYDKELYNSFVSVRVYGIADASQSNETTNSHDIEEDDLVAHSSSRETLPFWRVIPRIALYHCAEDDTPAEDEDNQLPSIPFSTTYKVPSAKLEKLWDSLQFGANAVKIRLLSYLSSSALFRKSQVDSNVVNWHGIALLHGPPGTGKTSLCRALAHKLAIRSGGGLHGRTCYLVEVQADALYSKFFGESARNVGSLFRAIRELAHEAEHVFVLLDEVESLALARGTGATDDGQPSDSMRSVNALLTALDGLRDTHNVTVLATSNLLTRIDPAFLDRVDVNERIPEPGLHARHHIIAETVSELIRVGAVQREMHEDAFNNLTRSVALAAKGLSGRTLRKLPLLAHAAQARGAAKAVRATSFLQALKTQAVLARKAK